MADWKLVVDNKKHCSRTDCPEINPQELSSFFKSSRSKQKVGSECKTCHMAGKQKYYTTEEYKQNEKEWRDEYYKKPEVKERSTRVKKEYYLNKGKKTLKDYNLKIRFGISIEQFEEMLKQQNHLCAICNRPETARDKSGTVKTLSVDHCHKTGKIRGLLCNICNRGIGFLKDDLDILSNAFNYILKSKAA